MAANSGRLIVGIVMLAVFVAALVVMFMPVFDGMNALNYMDSLYNSISKGSANYIPALEQDLAQHGGEPFTATLAMKDAELAQAVAALFEGAGGSVEATGKEVQVSGELTRTLRSCLADAGQVFANESKGVEGKYGRGGKETMFVWWSALKALDKDLKKQGRFSEAALVTKVKKKAVECAYNYYGIDALKISENLGIVIFSLAFYVVYTLWYGYAIMYIFEGCGLRLSH